MDAALQEMVRKRANRRCEYCLIPEALVSTPFQFDHVIARSHGGTTSPDNLALACFHCNNFKGTNLAGIDPQTQEIVRLFTPRTDQRQEHFSWAAEKIAGLTAIGRATIETLRLNHPHRMVVRRYLIREGVHFA